MKRSRDEVILNIAASLDEIHTAVIKNNNLGNSISPSQIFLKNGLNSHIIKEAINYLISNGVLFRSEKKANRQYVYRWKDSVKDSFDALRVAETVYRRIRKQNFPTLIQAHSHISLSTISDTQLVTELRNRGWEVTCKRNKEVTTIIEETL